MTRSPGHLPPSFFARPAEVVAPELIGCLLVKRQPTGELLWGVIVETEAYSQGEPACHGHRRRSPSNETLAATLKGCSKRYERFCQRYRHHAKGAPKCHWGSRMLRWGCPGFVDRSIGVTP